MSRIVVRGSGDVGSAVAHRLFFAGYQVLIHDRSQPTGSRRGMSFIDAFFDGQAKLEGVHAVLIDDLGEVPTLLTMHEMIPVTTEPLDQCLLAIGPDVLVDARMRKHDTVQSIRGMAPLTIGLGPGFAAGETSDFAIETAWGTDLGRVLTDGSTKPLAGEPRDLGGHGRDRYVYSPAAGVFRTNCAIGDTVQAGSIVAEVDGMPLRAPLSGVLRGLTRDGVELSQGAKVIEVDSRGEGAIVTGIGERPAAIANGVFEAIQRWEVTPQTDKETH